MLLALILAAATSNLMSPTPISSTTVGAPAPQDVALIGTTMRKGDDGQTLYCKKETWSESLIPKNVCATQEQWDQITQNGKDYKRSIDAHYGRTSSGGP